jgi:hypothetical protein
MANRQHARDIMPKAFCSAFRETTQCEGEDMDFRVFKRQSAVPLPCGVAPT